MNGSWTNWKISPSPSEKNLPLPDVYNVYLLNESLIKKKNAFFDFNIIFSFVLLLFLFKIEFRAAFELENA